MRTKRSDVIYCGVNKDIIKSAKPIYNKERLKMFYTFFTERYNIHKKKDVLKLERPWTDNEVLSQFKFCNVRREHDRTSRWLIENISSTKEDLKTKVYKSLIFRLYNRIETAEIINLNDKDFFEGDWVERASSLLTDKSNYPEDYRFFTNAYKTGGIVNGLRRTYNIDGKIYPKYVLPLYGVKDMINNNLFERIINSKDQLECFYLLKGSMKGIGNFIAYQLFVDLSYIEEFKFSENEFTIAGPGCDYGIRMLFEDRDSLTNEEILFWMRENFVRICEENNLNLDLNELFDDLPQYDRCLNVMSLENCFCEFQKYVRGNSDDMRNPRNRYKEFVNALDSIK